MDMLRSADARIARDQAAAVISPAQTSAMSTKGAECAALDQQINSLLRFYPCRHRTLRTGIRGCSGSGRLRAMMWALDCELPVYAK